MKAIDYRIAPASDVAAAVAMLAEDDFAQPIAGGQSLGAMLNLRLAQPDCVVDLAPIASLCDTRIEGDQLVLGAMVTHAAIEDGRFTDVSHGMLAQVARGIAYRAVRNSGTVGGSLCHADPAADWIAAMAALGARLDVSGPEGERQLAAAEFMRSAFETRLAEAEVLTAIRVPALSPAARWAYRKFCRKTGEFAQAIVAGLVDSERGIERLVLAALDGPPVVIERPGLVEALATPATRQALLDEPALALSGHRRVLHAALMAQAAHDLGAL
ncbi:FAD binding domain-containing protein [Salinisphaera sp. SPP-AMP-43]|uniref:FAD binding domain-containing protein n=1 Tax=Salinisphaera sp. SPP-AMP-43 TaxID=3121288 RepID=UPI003C6E7B92